MRYRSILVVLLLLGAALKAYAVPEAVGAAAVCGSCCVAEAGDPGRDEAFGKPAGAWTVGVVRSAPAPLPDAVPRVRASAPAPACTPGSTRLLL